MTVHELIAALCVMPQGAQVVVEDASAHPGPAVRRLGNGEIQTVELGWWESNGIALVELWRDDVSMSGPHPGVLLGSLEYTPQLSIAQLVTQMSDDEVRALLAEVLRREGEPELTPREAGIAGGMYELTDEEMMRRIRKLRRGE